MIQISILLNRFFFCCQIPLLWHWYQGNQRLLPFRLFGQGTHKVRYHWMIILVVFARHTINIWFNNLRFSQRPVERNMLGVAYWLVPRFRLESKSSCSQKTCALRFWWYAYSKQGPPLLVCHLHTRNDVHTT